MGEPLKAGTIEFAPVENGTSSGATISNGEYSIPQPKGLPAGEYIVRIGANDATEQPIEVPGESNKIAKELIPNTYNTKSTLRFRVEDKKDNVFDSTWKRRSKSLSQSLRRSEFIDPGGSFGHHVHLES